MIRPQPESERAKGLLMVGIALDSARGIDRRRTPDFILY
jgi:hypothetical protein